MRTVTEYCTIAKIDSFNFSCFPNNSFEFIQFGLVFITKWFGFYYDYYNLVIITSVFPFDWIKSKALDSSPLFTLIMLKFMAKGADIKKTAQEKGA